MDLETLRSLQEAARLHAVRAFIGKDTQYNPHLLNITEINECAISQYETWLTQYDFGWERVLKWEQRSAHFAAIDVAIWYDGRLAGLCWATPKQSREKVFVLYLERNPDNALPTKGYIAPLGLRAVCSYGLLLDMRYIVVNDPDPGARRAYQTEGFHFIPGIGLAYDLTREYDGHNREADSYEQ
ncbi:putative uncharacterized protein [Pseudomonas sp. StFLB209]|uniref:hypothetical protein n=1 Tax=Pseudomonas sp. StFLB209 TaxID=1028989 RepID=UPI0004F67B21|nr:hypothetical protein [Pseudomonas sp. StFLB209]BAP45219.1 putative uncharacterized protein [Pseudomonas sp. StFLB209]